MVVIVLVAVVVVSAAILDRFREYSGSSTISPTGEFVSW